MRVSLSLMLCALFVITTAQAQDVRERRPVTVKVTGFVSEETEALQSEVLDLLRTELTLQGTTVSGKPELTMLVRALEIERAAGNEIVLSVVTMHSLPEAVVQANKEAEVFYLTLSEEKRAEMPEEGTWVRQHMSEDFIRDFMRPHEHDIVVVPRSDLERAVSEIVEAFIERHGYYAVMPDQR